MPKELDKVCKTVRDLRGALNESQPQFAVRLGTSLRSIARYETSRPPKGKVLAQLEQIARTLGLDEYAQVFRAALSEEFGVSEAPIPVRSPRPAKAVPDLENISEDEKAWCSSLVLALRDERFSEVSNKVKRLLKKPRAEYEYRTDVMNRLLNVLSAYARLRNEGRTHGEIAKMFNLPEELLASYVATVDPQYGLISQVMSEYLKWKAVGEALALGANASNLGNEMDVPQFAVDAIDKIFKQFKFGLDPLGAEE